jgi:ribosomal protein L40E
MTDSASKTCSNCGTVNPTESKFCKKCGASISTMETCPQCGSKLDSDAVFCRQCGFEVKRQKIVQPTLKAMKRLPFGLEILIALGALGALFYFASAIMAFWAASTIFRYGSGTLTLVGVIWLAFALCQVVLALGLWKLKEWARKSVILLIILGIIGAFYNPVYGITSIVYSIIILYYLNTAHIKLLFLQGETGTTGRLTREGTTTVAPVRQICPSCGRKGKPGARFCMKCGAEMKEEVQ